MSDAGTRTHLTLAFDESAVGDLAELRRRYDPAMATGVNPHVTVVYPEEYADTELLMNRARSLAEHTTPFTFSATRFVTDGDDGSNGVFVELNDPTSSWHVLRRELLAPPFTPIDVQPHMTIAHPRTTDLGPNAWTDLRDQPVSCHLVADALELTVTSASNTRKTIDRLPLVGTSRALCVGVLPVANGRLLLGHRHPERTWYPNAWDVIGGHVDAGESLLTTACREAAEELGVAIAAEDLVHLDTLVTNDVELVLFTTSHWEGTPSNNAPEEHSAIRWFERGDLDTLSLADPALRGAAHAALRPPS